MKVYVQVPVTGREWKEALREADALSEKVTAAGHEAVNPLRLMDNGQSGAPETMAPTREATARAMGRERLALVMETICATGIRVSELRYITVEAARLGQEEISLKGKIRVILLPAKLRRKLLDYARKNKTASCEIFLTRSGKGLGRKQIWAEMKEACAAAGVAPGKVFPHNLRHLFARTFYRVCRDIVKLADVLGHSSVETTRIYLVSTGAEHAKTLEKLGLVV